MTGSMAGAEDPAIYECLTNDVYVYGSVSLAMAMAKETNIIQCLCTAHSPLMSSDIAAQLKLKKRYVREVLNSLTVIGLVQLEAGTGGKEGQEARYWVPLTYRQTLQKAGVNCLIVSGSARQFAGVRQCLDLDGPSSVESMPTCEAEAERYNVMDEWNDLHLDCLTEGILSTPGLKTQLEQGLTVLEVGCGTGRLALHLAALFSKSQFTLSDLNPEPLQRAQARAHDLGLANVSFRTLDIFHMPDDVRGNVDWLLACYVIHDLSRPLDALRAIREALVPGGHFSLVDFFVSSYLAENMKGSCKGAAAALYSMGIFHCIPESCRDSNADSKETLGACWGEEKAKQLVENAGMEILGVVRSKNLDSAVAVCMCQKSK